MIKDAQDLRQMKSLAKGGGGSIFEVEILSRDLAARAGSNRAVAKYMLSDDPAFQINFKQEVSLMYFLEAKYPRHFAKLLGFDPLRLCIVMTAYKAGSMHRYYRKTAAVSRLLSVKFLSDIGHAVMYMHREQIAHRDLKTDNVLIDTRTIPHTAVITDFGIARILNQDEMKVKEFPVSNHRGFSLLYAAPESIEQFRTRSSVAENSAARWKAGDVYSFGCIIYETFCHVRPWK